MLRLRCRKRDWKKKDAYLTSINMINEDERWKSIENIDVKMQKERLEKERERKRVIAEAGPLNTFIMRTLLIS